jgi:hypothetical protein
MPVLQRSREQCARRSERLELLAVVAEADDQRPCAHLAQRVEQDVNALVVEQLAEVESGRLVVREPRGEPFGVALVRKALVGVAGVRRIPARLVEQGGERALTILDPELVDVDTRRNLVHVVDVADDVLEHGTDVRGADEDGVRRSQRRASPL